MSTSGMRIEMELEAFTKMKKDNATLKALVRELAGALDGWSDSKDDLALVELLERAKKAGMP